MITYKNDIYVRFGKRLFQNKDITKRLSKPLRHKSVARASKKLDVQIEVIYSLIT